MLLVAPALLKFPFVEVLPSLDAYGSIHSEPVHCLSLVVGRRLEEYIVPMPGAENRTTRLERCAKKSDRFLSNYQASSAPSSKLISEMLHASVLLNQRNN